MMNKSFIATVGGAAAVIMSITGAASGCDAGAENSAAATSCRSSKGLGLSGVQKDNARTIVDTARSMGMGRRGAEVGVMAALQESSLRHDSAPGDGGIAYGLFQMHAGSYWGSVSAVTEPSTAAERFFKELRKVKGWKNMSRNDAAQSVEKSGHPFAYASRESLAKKIVAWAWC
ncbi:hypothetical protein [Microbispora sp. NPDC049125]|uniref:hypothetical protein n=1 Tax=Microbispora sp. NPDC049125 TaxID=3154929 RepID=UPI003466DCB6